MTPINTFMDMINPQIAFLSHPCVSLKIVNAKLVLDQTDAQMDSVDATEKTLKIPARSSKGMSQLCLPKPMLMVTETTMDSAKMATHAAINSQSSHHSTLATTARQ